MFQPYVFFEVNPHNTISRKRDRIGKKKAWLRHKLINSTLLAEGEGVTATSLGQRPSGGGKYIILRSLRIIHRVPSAEGATATSLGILNLIDQYKKINRKNAPNELSLRNNDKTRRIDHGA